MEFYMLREKKERFAQLKSTIEDYFNTPKCKKCGNYSTYLSNLKVKFRDKETTDFYDVWGYTVISSGIQEKIKGFKNFNLLPIEIEVDKKERLDEELYKLARIETTGKGGYLQNIHGEKFAHCEECGLPIEVFSSPEGLSVDENEWDGSDIFYFNNWYGNIIITEKVYQVLNETNTKNITFTNLKDYIV